MQRGFSGNLACTAPLRPKLNLLIQIRVATPRPRELGSRHLHPIESAFFGVRAFFAPRKPHYLKIPEAAIRNLSTFSGASKRIRQGGKSAQADIGKNGS
jgi:hypothetical protein